MKCCVAGWRVGELDGDDRRRRARRHMGMAWTGHSQPDCLRLAIDLATDGLALREEIHTRGQGARTDAPGRRVAGAAAAWHD